MTTDELRDELAREMGWVLQHDEKTPCTYWWNRFTNEQRVMGTHPIPATLDGAAAAMPEGFKWSKHGTYGRARCATYRAYDNKNRMVAIVEDTGNELHDRLALALAAHKAMKGKA